MQQLYYKTDDQQVLQITQMKSQDNNHNNTLALRIEDNSSQLFAAPSRSSMTKSTPKTRHIRIGQLQKTSASAKRDLASKRQKTNQEQHGGSKMRKVAVTSPTEESMTGSCVPFIGIMQRSNANYSLIAKTDKKKQAYNNNDLGELLTQSPAQKKFGKASGMSDHQGALLRSRQLKETSELVCISSQLNKPPN